MGGRAQLLPPLPDRTPTAISLLRVTAGAGAAVCIILRRQRSGRHGGGACPRSGGARCSRSTSASGAQGASTCTRQTYSPSHGCACRYGPSTAPQLSHPQRCILARRVAPHHPPSHFACLHPPPAVRTARDLRFHCWGCGGGGEHLCEWDCAANVTRLASRMPTALRTLCAARRHAARLSGTRALCRWARGGQPLRQEAGGRGRGQPAGGCGERPGGEGRGGGRAVAHLLRGRQASCRHSSHIRPRCGVHRCLHLECCSSCVCGFGRGEREE